MELRLLQEGLRQRRLFIAGELSDGEGKHSSFVVVFRKEFPSRAVARTEK